MTATRGTETAAAAHAAPTPVIVHLSGRLRGRTQRLRGDHLRVGTTAGADVALHPEELPAAAATASGDIATLEHRGSSFRLVAAEDTDVWVNGERVGEIVLASGDVIEIGQGGPLLRFRLYKPGSRAYKSLLEAFSDCVDCARNSGPSRTRRAGILVGGVAWEIITQTAPWIRLALIISVLGLTAAVAGLWNRNVQLERRLEAETVRLRGLADLLERTDRTRVTPDDLAETRARLERRVSDTVARLEALEAAGAARERVIAAAARSVVFLQGGYGFVQPSTGRALRYVGRGPDGAPLLGPDGQPRLTFDGNGPEVEILYTGTGFVVSRDGDLLTNRHVAVPWEFDDSARAILAQGLAPVMRRFVGYLPGRAEPFEVSLIRASDRADVALLRTDLAVGELPPLELAATPPRAGDEVVVLGYPTGIQALMVRADPVFVESLMAGGSLGFWSVAVALARHGDIAPLATMGIVGQITSSSVVYDAETTHGGSGGPVLGLDGRVVAVNSAVVPEFGGSNLGVPTREARALLAPGEVD